MYNTIKINGKEFTAFDDYVFDEITGQWIAIEDMIEFERAINEDNERTLDKMIEDISWDDYMASVEQDNKRYEDSQAEQSAMYEDFSFGI